MNKLLTAILAALMLAGALSALCGATSVPLRHSVALVGEGSSPLPLLLSAPAPLSEASSHVD
jgi:hypothetical protein